MLVLGDDRHGRLELVKRTCEPVPKPHARGDSHANREQDESRGLIAGRDVTLTVPLDVQRDHHDQQE